MAERQRSTTGARRAGAAAGPSAGGGRGARSGARRAAPAGPITLDAEIGRTTLVGATVLRRVGPKLGVRTIRDLLFYLPRRYDDLRALSTARELNHVPEGEPASARLQVRGLRVQQTFRRQVQRTTAYLGDDTGELEATWFGRRYVERRLHEGDWIVVSGKIRRRGFITSFDNPEFQPDDGTALLHAGRIVPVYRLTAGLTAATLRRAIRQALDAVGHGYPEYLTPSLRAAADVGPITEALENIHYPEAFPARDAALRRLGFDELLALEIGMVVRERQRAVAVGSPVAVTPEQVARGVASVEEVLTAQLRGRGVVDALARLTDDQAAAVAAVAGDLGRPQPMMRLLQGDVGSGKTAVAALALSFVADAGRQGAMLAPTDLLARQHHVALRRLLEPLGHQVTLLTGSLPAAERRAALELLAAPSAGRGVTGETSGLVVVGTHALVQEAVTFADLALAVVDEQHRFGVAQREALGAKGAAVHQLLMTATPIPRTLGQILLADLDVSDLRSLPAGRQKILTGVRHSDELAGTARDPGRGAYPLIVREVQAGHRAFVVVPLVEEDEESAARSADEMAAALPAALEEAGRRTALDAATPRVGVVHGQMKAAVRDVVMDAFRRGEIDVLVGTTVLEVGVDVPEATVMLILDADRFGLAQLHQLRGRVGRGEAQSYCILVSDSNDATAKARLQALVDHNDGFDLAELDLELRQEGELLGLHQSGLPTLRIASLRDPEDRRRALQAREMAERLVDARGALSPDLGQLTVELRSGWLARVGAGEVLADADADDSTDARAAAPATRGATTSESIDG